MVSYLIYKLEKIYMLAILVYLPGRGYDLRRRALGIF